MTDTTLDPRRHAYRRDLADARLEAQVRASRYVEARMGQVRAAIAPVVGAPNDGEALTTQLLFGETVRVFEEKDGWAWVQADADDYVGYAPAAAISLEVLPATHRIAALSTLAFPRPEVKSPPLFNLPAGARVSVERAENGFAALADGAYVPLQHLVEIDDFAQDFVALAERFVGAPYLWGGRTSVGIDCSGLVQIALRAAGIASPRDTDMQCAELGTPVTLADAPYALRHGDLIFWRGHVGIMMDATRLLHANAHHMQVVVEPLHDAVARIRTAGSEILAIRRLDT